MVVERHRASVEFGRQLAHGQGVDAVLSGKADRCFDDAFFG